MLRSRIAEGITDASITLPRAIMSAMGLNAALGLVMVITICCTLGDLDSVLKTNTQLPFIPIIYNATLDHAITKALVVIVIANINASVTTGIATASRQLWSFSRDRGLPFSSFFAYVCCLPIVYLYHY